jgi:hypothetical protein
MRCGKNDVRIVLKFQTVGTRGDLILIHAELADEANGVIAQVPAHGIVVRGAGERPAAEHEQVSATLEKRKDRGPILFGERRAGRQDQQAAAWVGQERAELVHRSKARAR